MSDRERALRVLRGPVAHQINFSFTALDGITTISVNHTTFERVAVAIERGGALSGGINLIFRHTMPYNAQALYFPQEDRTLTPPIAANSLLVKPIQGTRQEGALIHEAVHASFDLTFSTLRVVDSEAAAYIAIALYHRLTGFNSHHRRLQLRTNAYAVADSVLRTGQVELTALTNLRNSIAADSDYQSAGMNGSYISDG